MPVLSENKCESTRFELGIRCIEAERERFPKEYICTIILNAKAPFFRNMAFTDHSFLYGKMLSDKTKQHFLQEVMKMNEKKFAFAPSLTMFHMKTKVAIDQRQISISQPKTVLGIIPAGRKNVVFPLRNISTVTTERRLSWGRIILGIILCALSFGLAESLGGYCFIAAGLSLILALSGIGRSLSIRTGGGVYRLAIPWYSFGTLGNIKKCLDEGLCYEADKVDLFMHDERMVQMMKQVAQAR